MPHFESYEAELLDKRGWSIEMIRDHGSSHLAKCVANYDYKGLLTIGKEYALVIMRGELNPIASFFNDKEKIMVAHLSRFERIDNEK